MPDSRTGATVCRLRHHFSLGVERLSSPWGLLVLATTVLSALLAFAHFGEPTILSQFSPDADAALGLMWQVHAGFLAIAFAGLTIASQVYVDSPLAAGAARRAILARLRVGRLLSTGLISNLLIAIGAIWLPTDPAVLILFLVCCLPTVAFTMRGYATLGGLYSDPATVDLLIGVALSEEVVRAAFASNTRETEAAVATQSLTDIGILLDTPARKVDRIDIQHPRGAATIRQINPEILQMAVDELDHWAPPGHFAADTKSSLALVEKVLFTRPQIVLFARPHRKLRAKAVIFSIVAEDLSIVPTELIERVRSHLLKAVEYEDETFVSAEERILWEVNAVHDSANEALSIGAFRRAARAIDLLERANDAGWSVAHPGGAQAMNPDRRDWLLRPFAEMEFASGNSTRAADLLISSAISRSIRAAREKDFDRFVADLVSFQRIWTASLESSEATSAQSIERILIAIQNLAEFVLDPGSDHLRFRESCAWTFVNLAKDASDHGHHQTARRAVDYLIRLYQHGKGDETSLRSVQAGQLALTGWLLLRRSREQTFDPRLINILTSGFTRSDVFQARGLLESISNPSSRWEWWESEEFLPLDVNVVQISKFADIAASIAYSRSAGSIFDVISQQYASTASRMARELSSIDDLLWKELGFTPNVNDIVKSLEEVVRRWRIEEDGRLSNAPISTARIQEFREALGLAMSDPARLADYFEISDSESPPDDIERQVLGLNSFVPRHYFVDEVFNNTYANPSDLGSTFARAMLEGEESSVLTKLREVASHRGLVTLHALQALIRQLSHPEDYLLVLSFGDYDLGWWDFRRDIAKTKIATIHVDLGDDAELDVLLVNVSHSVKVRRAPEDKGGMSPIADTSISAGVFDDAPPGDEPRARVELGEVLQIWIVGDSAEGFVIESEGETEASTVPE